MVCYAVCRPVVCGENVFCCKISVLVTIVVSLPLLCKVNNQRQFCSAGNYPGGHIRQLCVFFLDTIASQEIS